MKAIEYWRQNYHQIFDCHLSGNFKASILILLYTVVVEENAVLF